MAVLCQDLVAESVDRRDPQLGEVALVTYLLRGPGKPVAHLERSLLGKRAEDDLAWQRPAG